MSRRLASGEIEYGVIEYGVILDRTSKGLGYWVAETCLTWKTAERMAKALRAGSDFPVSIKARTVVRGDWFDTTNPHTPEPNDVRRALGEDGDGK